MVRLKHVIVNDEILDEEMEKYEMVNDEINTR